MKIKQINMLDGLSFAFFNPKNKIIFYDSLLNKYPKLKKAILEHEKLHYKEDYPNIIKIFIRELKDYYLIRKKYWNELQELRKEREKLYDTESGLSYFLMNSFLMFYIILVELYFKIRNW